MNLEQALEKFDVAPIELGGFGVIDRIFVPKGASASERAYWIARRIKQMVEEGFLRMFQR